jgi:hypothetical protein
MKEQTALGSCMICGRPITHAFVVCAACERRFSLPASKRLWPAWAKALNKLHTAQQRNERDYIAYMVDVGAGRIAYDGACYGERGDE